MQFWTKPGCPGVNPHVVDYASLRMALLRVVEWVSEDRGASVSAPGLVSGLGGTSLCSAVRLDVMW